MPPLKGRPGRNQYAPIQRSNAPTLAPSRLTSRDVSEVQAARPHLPVVERSWPLVGQTACLLLRRLQVGKRADRKRIVVAENRAEERGYRRRLATCEAAGWAACATPTPRTCASAIVPPVPLAKPVSKPKPSIAWDSESVSALDYVPCSPLENLESRREGLGTRMPSYMLASGISWDDCPVPQRAGNSLW